MKSIGFLKLLKEVICTEDPPKEGQDKAKEYLEEHLAADYGEYLDKPPEHHDKVIKRMYRNTKYADEPPERLREIFKEQMERRQRVTH